MDTYTWDNHLPCLNPHCKSHGKPHPNCRCYGMAEGGEVAQRCSGPHKEDCEYYMAEGGEIDPSQVVPDQESIDPSLVQVNEPIKPDEVRLDSDSYLEQAKAGAEGLAKGVLGDAAKYAEVKSGISTKEDIERREKDFPATASATKTVGRVAPFLLGPEGAGAKVLFNMLTGVSYAASDNITKALMDQPGGDLNGAVANTLIDGGLDGLMYSLTDGLFSAAGKSKIVQDPKWIKKAEDTLIELANKPINKALEATGAYALFHSGQKAATEIAEYGAIKKYLQPYIEKIIDKPLSKANQYVGDAVLNTLIKTNYFSIPSVIKYAQKIAAGQSALSHAIEGIFKSVETGVRKELKPEASEKIDDWVKSGGVDKEIEEDASQGFASGGAVQSPRQAFAVAYPMQNTMLSATRGRVYKYLNSIRPTPNQPKLPFDSETPQKEKQKQYKSALEVAANPISVLDKVSNGTVTPQDMRHLTQMYPEVYGHMSSKLTERIVNAQLSGEKPSYKKRQAMSLFLGASLDSTFTPQAIAAVQMTYAMKGQPQQQGTKQTKDTSKLSKAVPSYLTSEQARVQRQQNQKS